MRESRTRRSALATKLAPVLFLSGCAAGAVHAPITSLEFNRANNQVNVPVTIAGAGPYWFIIDTGASGFGMVDAAFAETACAEVVNTVIVSDGSGQNRRELNEIRCPDIKIAAAAFGDLALIAHEFRRAMDDGNERLGMLGMEAFRSTPFAIDYRTGRVEFGDAATIAADDGDPHVLETPLFEDGGDEIVVELKIADVVIPAVVDTGSASGFNLPCEAVRALAPEDAWREAAHAKSFGNEYVLYEAELPHSLELLGHIIDKPTVRCNDHHGVGIVGYEVLKSYRLTVDLPNRRVRID